MRDDRPLDELWPAYSKPKDDELLSSWLVRLAMAHGLKLHTFCSMTWPGKAIWNRDIDKSADAEILETLSYKTRTPFERVRSTTLAAYEDAIHEKHNRFGPASWIMPVGIYHRTRRQFGLQYCPTCLAEDQESYYRRRWRLAFMVICERHHMMLRDRCPHCEAAVNFHRNELGDHRKFVAISLTQCHVCGFDLREALSDPPLHPITSDEIKFCAALLQAMDNGIIQVSDSMVTYSHLYFSVLRQLMKILAMQNKRIERLRQAISDAYEVEIYTPPFSRSHSDVQELGIKERRQLLGLVRCLLEGWPERFIELSRNYKIWSSLWLRHFEPCRRERARTAPFWFWSVVHDYLYRARYCPSDEETEAAVRYLKRSDAVLNNSTLSRLLGVAVLRRKVILKDS